MNDAASDTLTSTTVGLRVARADYADPRQAEAVVALLDVYARDSMGGGEALPADVRERLLLGLAAHPSAFSLLAWEGETPIGLTNCFTLYSTFAAAPLVNIHDIVTHPEHRRKGVARALFAGIEAEARAIGACKVTLEVLSGNVGAKALYASLGYGDYVLEPAAGHALYWQKRLT